tara:strand:- start:1365 stop:1967 length:603 start_codon:yes stop_codon:yes gene_type:complete
MSTDEPLARLTASLSRLPGIGRKSAERMAVQIARDTDGLLMEIAHALKDVHENVRCCGQCGNITTTESDPCRLCVDPSRDDALLCVVEEPADIVAIERSGGYRGRYHALMGKLSPIRGQGPDELTIGKLLERVASAGVTEIVLALSTDVEGDATASYLAEHLDAKGVRVSRLAFGLPAGSGIGYSDAVTLARAMNGRQSI